MDLFISTQRIKVLNADTQVSLGRWGGFKIVLRNSQQSEVKLQTPSAGLRPCPWDSPLAPAMEYRVSSVGWAAALGWAGEAGDQV